MHSSRIAENGAREMAKGVLPLGDQSGERKNSERAVADEAVRRLAAEAGNFHRGLDIAGLRRDTSEILARESGRPTREIQPGDVALPVGEMVKRGKFEDGRPQGEKQKPTDRASSTEGPQRTPEVRVEFSDASNRDHARAKPDFIVKKNGSIVAKSDFEKHGGNVLIHLERDPGQLDPSKYPAQAAAAERLLSYVSGRLKQDYPEAEKKGVRFHDDQNLISEKAERAIGLRNESATAANMTPQTRHAIEEMRRFNGAGKGSMSR